MNPVRSAATVLYTPVAPAPDELSEEDDPRLTLAMEEYLAALEAGERPNREPFLARHPDVAEMLPPLLDNLDFVHQVAPQFRSSPGQEFKSAAPASLGDYRIVREVGRGGMGVVYEAEQISLARRVALKVLPFAAVMDPRRLARFRNEAQAAATLTHQHIVPVYAVGCARGVHYYAMQFIDGCTLADTIGQLRQAAGKNSNDLPSRSSSAAKQLAQGLTNGRGAVRTPGDQPPAVLPVLPQHTAPSADTTRPAQAAISTENSHVGAHYVRAVTELAVQIAEALDYAHRQGVVHRDIKPGNLLLDMQGNPWITDFGLARIEADASLTMTGDLLGTLRYMSPEQALAQRVVVDHRTDIYSFGVTFYELLTLEPVFAANGRQELLRDIAFREPTPLRKLQRGLSADLETIVMKAIAKNPAERYATAQEMADDLRRLLADQPIHARRPSILMRVRKWSRRHRAVVTAASLVAGGALLLGAGLLWRERSQTLSALVLADANFRNAQNTVDKYLTAVSQNKLLDAPGMEPLRTELLETAVQYYQDFAAQHADDPALKAELAAAHIRLAGIYNQTGSNRWIDEMGHVIAIVEPLVDEGADVSQWKSLREGVFFREYRAGDIEEKDGLKAVVVSTRGIAVWEKLCKAHPDVPGFACDLAGLHMIRAFGLFPVQNPKSLGAAMESYEQAVTNWERFPDSVSGTPRQLMLGRALWSLATGHRLEGRWEDAYKSASRAAQVLAAPDRLLVFASDYDDLLRDTFSELRVAALSLNRREEATEIMRKYASLDVNSSGGYVARGLVFERLHEPEKAHADFNRAIELEPNNANLYAARGDFHLRQRHYQEALADFNRHFEMGSNRIDIQCRLGAIHTKTGDPDAAEADYKKAFEMAAQSGATHNEAFVYRFRAAVRYSQGEYQEAIADNSRLLEIDPDHAAEILNLRGTAYHNGLSDKGKALADFTKAIELAPTNAQFHSNRGSSYMYLGRYREALDDINMALELDPNCWHALMGRCYVLLRMLRYDEALKAINHGIERAPGEPRLWHARSDVYARLEKYDEALADMGAAVERAESDEDYCEMHIARGRLKRRMGMFAEADADFKLACERFGNRISLANAKAELGRYEEALEEVPAASDLRIKLLINMKQCERALDELAHVEKDFPERSVPHSLHGIALAELERYDEAAREFSRAIELAPYWVEDWYQRGWIASMQGRYDAARKDFEEAVRIDEFNPLALRRLAWFLATCPDNAQRDPARAVTLAEKAASARPSEGVFWYTLGVCQYSRGDYEAARAACQRAIDMRDLPYSPLKEPRVATDYDHYAGFFLAMSLWQVGDKEKGRQVYAEAIAWRDQQAPNAEALRQFLGEKQAVQALAKQRPAATADQSANQ